MIELITDIQCYKLVVTSLIIAHLRQSFRPLRNAVLCMLLEERVSFLHLRNSSFNFDFLNKRRHGGKWNVFDGKFCRTLLLKC
jgi:hypothetical protein